MQFKESSGMCGVCFFTFFFVVNAVTLRMRQDRLTGTVGQSVLLPAFYTNSDSGGYLRITWTKNGTRIVDFRCPSDRNDNFFRCSQTIPIPDHYKYRAVLFPENASLLMRDLQISESGIYELSVSHSKGTEKGRLYLTVQPGTTERFGTTEGTGTTERFGTTERASTGHKLGSHSGLEFILPLVGIAIFVISLLLTLKIRSGCNRAQDQTEKRNAAQDHQRSQERAGVLYAELQWPQHVREEKKTHIQK